MSKAFASQADLAEKKITFEQLSAHCWAYTAEGDPNSGVVIGERSILVSDATATPEMAKDLIAKIRSVSDKPIQYVLLTHYHAVRVLGASAFKAEGASDIIASQGTYELIVERGAADMKSGLAARRAIATQARRRQRPWCSTRAAAEQSWMTPRPMITGMKIRSALIPVSAETHESVSSAPKRISPGTCMNQ